MTLLDMQGMEAKGDTGGYGCGSALSVLLCIVGLGEGE